MGSYNPETAPTRFWAKVTPEGDCWSWVGCRMPNGYGYFDKGYAHRWAYEHMVGEIPPGPRNWTTSAARGTA